MTKLKANFRKWCREDAESLSYHANNINIWNNVRDFFPHPYSINDANQYIDYCLRSPISTDYAITINDDAVGGIGIVPKIDIERISAEIGFWIGEELWGQGIMTDIVKCFTKFVFETTKISHLYASAFHYNIGSMRVLERAGYRFVGIMKQSAIKNNQIVDMHYYEKIKQS